jgi:capsular exopolysaccharide synthesis family protein
MTLNKHPLSPNGASEAAPVGENLQLDYNRIINQVVNYWYIVLLSIVVGVSIAFLINRYSPHVYPVTASLIVKEAEDASGADLLYNNPLVNFSRNYLNEIYLLKSYPLVQKVVEDLNFDITFYKQGNILTTEAYDDIPVEAFADREKSSKASKFLFTPLNSSEYELEPIEGEEGLSRKRFMFGDTIIYGDFTGILNVRNDIELNTILGESLFFHYTPATNITDGYVRRLQADWAEEGAGVILLSIQGTTPRKEKDFLTGLISGYQNNDLENKNQAASRTVAFISEQLDGISDSLRHVERQLVQFKNQNVVGDLNTEGLRLYEKIESLELEKSKMLINKNYYKHLIDYIKQNQNLHQIILPSSVGITDPILTNLVSQMANIQMDIKMANQAENPLVAEGKRRINEIKQDIVESVRNLESTDKIRLNFLNSQIEDVERQLSHLPVAQRTLVSIQRNYTLLENLYIFLLQKRSEAAISQASNTSDIVLVNPPKIGGAISPRTSRNYVLGFTFGLFFPVFGLIVFELLNVKVQSKDDIEKLTRIPLIGGVGHKKAKSNLSVFERPKSALAESFRALRSNLNYFVGKQEKSVFLVTSSISGEGKTFTTLNLAGVLSMSGKKTLIVGADLRKPKIYDDFNLTNEIGLSSFLAGLCEFNDVVQPTSHRNLHFISGGPVPPNPSELLMDSRMKSFIQQARDSYDYVVIDTPPLAIVTDAFIISNYADHILFVVRQDYTPKNLLRTAEEYYASGKLKNISIILNDIHKSGPGYGYGYPYGYGYGYGYGYVNNGRTGISSYYEND